MEMNDETKTKITEELRHALHQAMSLPGTKLADSGYMLDYQLYGLSIMSDSGGKGISESDDRLRIAFLAPWEREYCGVTWKSTKGWHPRYQDGETLHQAGARHFRTVYGRTERGTRL